MSLSKLSLRIWVTATLSALSACGGSDPQQPLSVPQPTVSLIKVYENASCEPARVSAATLTKELADSNIGVTARSCPFDADAIYSAGCGTPIKGYLKIEIPQDQEQRAQALGYKAATTFPPLTASACPP